jgi:hypothetical protein
MLSIRHVHGQDIIVRTNNDSIKAKVLDITSDKIKFRYNNLKDGTIHEIHKNEVKQIIYANGSKVTIVYNRYEVSSDMLIHERSHAIKVDILSPLFNHFTCSYEVKLRRGMNFELKGSLIGTNLNKQIEHSEGFFIRTGIKFIKCTPSYSKGLKYIPPLKGTYFKPELIYSQFKRDEENETISYKNYAIDLLFGRQYLLSKSIVLEYFAGFGFGLQSSSKDVDFNYAYSHLFLGKKIPLIISGGLMMGFVF